jgi:hypothetical protein
METLPQQRADPRLNHNIGGKFDRHHEQSIGLKPAGRSMLPAFVFEAHPVIRVEDAVRGELEVIAWRDGLKGK